jgi:hypothetical protein
MKLLVLISGKLNSGKNTLSDLIKNKIYSSCRTSQASFALAVKESARDDFRRVSELVNDVCVDVLDCISDPDERNNVQQHFIKLITDDDSWFEKKNDFSRIILQTYGTNIFRNRVDDNYWINLLKLELKENTDDVVFITDTRFVNEISEMEKEFRVLKLRVEREKELGVIDEHESENHLDEYKEWDYIIPNNGSLEDLNTSAETLSKLILNTISK